MLYFLLYQFLYKKIPFLRKFLSHRCFLPSKSVICDGPGFKIRIRSPRTSVIGRSLLFSKIWEPEVTSVVLQKIQKGWHVLDVGADIGYYSLLFVTKVGSLGRVAAFEPDPEPWEILNDNVAKFKNISTYHFALSDYFGYGVMKKANRGQLFPDKKQSDDSSSTVKMVPLNDFFSKIGWNRLDLVKIDTEGAELSILKGMDKILEKYHPHILLEIHPRQLKQVFSSSAEQVMSFLTKKYPYCLTPIDRNTLDIPANGNITVWGDWQEKT